MIFENKTKFLVRETYRQAKKNEYSIVENMSDDMLDYFSRNTEIKDIKNLMIQRFAYGVKKTQDGRYEQYVRGASAAGINSNLYETISSGIATKIINNLANLFTMPTQHYEFIGDSSLQVEEVEELIKSQRENANFDLEMITADRISCAVGAGPILIQIKGNSLNYKSFSPGSINFIFGSEIEDGGALRPVDELDIEDASAVVIELEKNEISDTRKFLAIMGRSKEFEYGRYVTYEASDWMAIPDVGMGGIDYMIDGKPANPLSYWIEKTGAVGPEYPIIIIHSGLQLIRKKIVEISSSLYENCLELDLGFSRILKDALVASNGSKVLSNPVGSPLPPSLEGNVVLGLEQKLESLSVGGEHSRIGLEVLTGLAKAVAEGYSVPGYSVMQEGTFNESGISLLIKNKPLQDHRNFRIKLNRSEVNKCFLIEKNLLEFSLGKDLGEVTQLWHPGSFDMPETELQRAERLKVELENNFISYLQAIRHFYGLRTDEEAEQMIEKINESKEEKANEYVEEDE